MAVSCLAWEAMDQQCVLGMLLDDCGFTLRFKIMKLLECLSGIGWVKGKT